MLKEWQQKRGFTVPQAAAFFCTTKSTYEKWLYQNNRTPQYIFKMIEMDNKIQKFLETKNKEF